VDLFLPPYTAENSFQLGCRANRSETLILKDLMFPYLGTSQLKTIKMAKYLNSGDHLTLNYLRSLVHAMTCADLFLFSQPELTSTPNFVVEVIKSDGKKALVLDCHYPEDEVYRVGCLLRPFQFLLAGIPKTFLINKAGNDKWG
jgi:hypothetical protein